jgi:hypothetical protein
MDAVVYTIERTYMRSRLIFQRGDDRRSLVRLDEGTDGSVYLGPFDDVGEVEYAVHQTHSPSPTLRVDYSDFSGFRRVIAPKISLHPAKAAKAAQIHVRGLGGTQRTGKSIPDVVGNWDVLVDAPQQPIFIVCPPFTALPRAEAPGRRIRCCRSSE